MRDPEAFGAFVRRVAPEHAHLIFAEIQREADAGHERWVALYEQLRYVVEDNARLRARLAAVDDRDDR